MYATIKNVSSLCLYLKFIYNLKLYKHVQPPPFVFRQAEKLKLFRNHNSVFFCGLCHFGVYRNDKNSLFESGSRKKSRLIGMCDVWGRVTTYWAAADAASSPNRLHSIRTHIQNEDCNVNPTIGYNRLAKTNPAPRHMLFALGKRSSNNPPTADKFHALGSQDLLDRALIIAKPSLLDWQCAAYSCK